MSGLKGENLVFVMKSLSHLWALKEIDEQYPLTYPTVRLKLDNVIQKVKFSEDYQTNPILRSSKD